MSTEPFVQYNYFFVATKGFIEAWFNQDPKIIFNNEYLTNLYSFEKDVLKEIYLQKLPTANDILIKNGIKPEELIPPFYETKFIRFLQECNDLLDKVNLEKDTHELYNQIDSAKVYNNFDYLILYFLFFELTF